MVKRTDCISKYTFFLIPTKNYLKNRLEYWNSCYMNNCTLGKFNYKKLALDFLGKITIAC